MREVLFAFTDMHFFPLIADDTGLIFKEKKNGEWRPSVMLRYGKIDSVDFFGSNVCINTTDGRLYKAAVLQKKRLMEIAAEKNILCIDHGRCPFEH